jgi:hypothetical protein
VVELLVYVENYGTRAIFQKEVYRIFGMPSVNLDETVVPYYNLLRNQVSLYNKMTQMTQPFNPVEESYIRKDTKGFLHTLLNGLTTIDLVVFTNAPDSVPEFVREEITNHIADIVLHFTGSSFKVVMHRIEPEWVGREVDLCCVSELLVR